MPTIVRIGDQDTSYSAEVTEDGKIGLYQEEILFARGTFQVEWFEESPRVTIQPEGSLEASIQSAFERALESMLEPGSRGSWNFKSPGLV